MRQSVSKALRDAAHRSVLGLQIAILIVAGIAPALMNQSVSAAQLTSRKVTIDKSAINSTDVSHVFNYTVPTSSAIQGIMYEFCTTPLGTCTLPAGMSVQSATHDSQSFSQATAFTAHATTDENDCSMSTNNYKMCFERTNGTAETAAAKTHTISNITAPNTYLTVYIRISTYSDNDFQTADLVDTGVVASAYVRQLTVSGRVAERLEFCIAAIDDDDTIPTNGCTGFPTTTQIAIGTIDNNAVYITPVEPTSTNLANDDYGVANINTNASGGVTLAYFPEPATNVTSSDADQLRSFRVLPTDCNASSATLTDQCFRSAGTTAVDFAAGVENFGMQIPCIDSNDGTRSTTANLGSVPTAYNNADNNTATTADCENPTSGDTGDEFAFDDTGTVTTIASSSTVVDDEVVKLRFGAAASATTPEGSYLVIITYIATPTF